MVDVFISYSRTNKDKVSQIAKGIEAAGYEVWWDAELPPHQSYGDVITAKIQMAKAAVVVWSAEAAASEWVRAEADVARNQKKLVQTALGDITPPLPFNQIQYANLGDWNGEQDHPEWRKVKASLADLCGPREARDDGPAYTFPAGAPAEATPAARPAPAKPAPAAAPVAAAAPVPPMADRSSVPRSGGVPVPIVVGGLVALLGLSGAGWWVMSNSASGNDDEATAEVAAADGDAQGLMAATPQNAPAAPAAAPAPAAPAPAAAPQQQAPAAPQQQQQYNRDVRLINQTGDTIMYLRWSDENQSSYGDDRLGSDVMGNGEYWDVTIDDGSGACIYDLKATTAGGRDVIRNGVNVCSVSSVTFN